MEHDSHDFEIFSMISFSFGLTCSGLALLSRLYSFPGDGCMKCLCILMISDLVNKHVNVLMKCGMYACPCLNSSCIFHFCFVDSKHFS